VRLFPHLESSAWTIWRSRGATATGVVDLERREPIEVFEGREATAVADWLRARPTIRIVARDRAGAYSEAVETAFAGTRSPIAGTCRATSETTFRENAAAARLGKSPTCSGRAPPRSGPVRQRGGTKEEMPLASPVGIAGCLRLLHLLGCPDLLRMRL
jgi:hypothetical protein